MNKKKRQNSFRSPVRALCIGWLLAALLPGAAHAADSAPFAPSASPLELQAPQLALPPPPQAPAPPVKVGVIDLGGSRVALPDPNIQLQYRPFEPRALVQGIRSIAGQPAHGVTVLYDVAAQIRAIAPDARIELFSADVFYDDPVRGLRITDLALDEALRWFRSNGVRIVCMAFGTGENAAIRRVIARAQAAGMVLIAAAPNDGSARFRWPGADPGLIEVASLVGTGGAVPMAATGSLVPVLADGTSRYIAEPASAPPRGNSFATARVAGLAAWLTAHDPQAPASALREQLAVSHHLKPGIQ